MFDEDNYLYLAGLLNSKVTEYIAEALNPTMNLSTGVLTKLPIWIVDEKREIINELVLENLTIYT